MWAHDTWKILRDLFSIKVKKKEVNVGPITRRRFSNPDHQPIPILEDSYKFILSLSLSQSSDQAHHPWRLRL